MSNIEGYSIQNGKPTPDNPVKIEYLEQEAIKYFEGKILEEGDNITITFDFIENLETVLNMLKEKDKEIEHQIEKRNNQKAELTILNQKQKEMNKLINTVKSYKGQIKRLEHTNRSYKGIISKQNKQIDLMARAIDNYDSQLEINTFRDKEHVKQYFKEIAERKSEE